MFAFRKLIWSLVTCFVFIVCTLRAAENTTLRSLESDYPRRIRPLLKEYCLGCHSTEKHKGDLDLEQFTSLNEVVKHPKVWQGVVEQLGLGEMPPKEKPQPTPEQREELVAWAGGVLDQIALTRAGDPGPVVLRRLSNAEYKYTIRDLTGMPSLDPGKEFPADSASGEGFMNVGNSLVMSPSLLTKYLDAAKDIAAHAVLLPDGIGFSPSTSQRDWAEERLAAIRQFYGRFSVNGGGSAVNLQGIKFDTKDGGVLPLKKYLEATLELRGLLPRLARNERGKGRGEGQLRKLAAERNLNGKYLTTLWNALNDTKPSLVLDPIRAKWRAAKPDDANTLVNDIAQWQQTLWRFTQVGHIGKRDGPKAWQVPVVPLAESREVRLKLPASTNGNEVTLYLAVSDAGDGNKHDFAVWENARLVAPGRTDLPLRDVRMAVKALTAHREKIFSSAAKCLATAAGINGALDKPAVARLAQEHGVESVALAAWLDYLGIGAGETRIESHITGKMESAQSYDFIKGWTGADALSVIANSSDQHVRVPGNMKPHGVAVHPSPKLRVIVGWRSPVAATLRVDGVVQHAHPECGNGVTWSVELRRGSSRQRLASGTSQGAKEIKFGPFENLAVQPGDVMSVVIGPRDGNHSCDLTAVDLNLTDGTRTWSLAKDVSPNILAGNPHADSLGNAGVWHFYSEPDKAGGAEPVLPTGSLLAKWQSSASIEEKVKLADEVQKLLLNGTAGLAKDAPDSVLYRQLTSLNGPLLSPILRGSGREEVLAETRNPKPETRNNQSLVTSAATDWGLDPALFGKHPNGAKVNETSLCVRAPSVIEVRLPADLAEGCEFVATAALHKETGREGSVQMQALTTKPAVLGLTVGAVREQGGKSTWSDGERPVSSDSPIIVNNGSAARQRIEAALDEFRQLFPAALCYTKIVPVDEVVTLTLYYREDDHLRRLMLDDAQAAELDRLWAELHYVSHDALKLVDAFEQLWQFATQDADPSAFEPLRQPIKQRAEEFKKLLVDTQPEHLDAVLKFADKAYRRPLTEAEKDELRLLYRKLRAEELPHGEAIRLTLARTLVAPAFLYRAEKPGPGDKPGPVTDWELATRLSYFLWSSAPDAELRAVATRGELRNPDVLAAQTRRMLRDPRTRRLATEFACAWLHIYDFDELGEKSERHFPTFTSLRGAMYEETIRFFTDLFQRDGSVLNILDADYTFLNADLAKHYGIPFEVRGEKGEGRSAPALAPRTSDLSPLTSDGWQRVDGVKKFSRGGILAQATTLAKQSGASRTSPILRGNWLCEVLLGEKLPRPPKDVPRLPEDEATETLTVRQLTEKHSTDPKCFGCHRRIDPYGYSLEAYDAIGRFRDHDLGGRLIEVKTKTMDGAEIDGLDGLRQYLLTKRRDAFLKQFCRKLLGYSLGRGVMLSDNPLVSEMRAQIKSHDCHISAAIETIVRSKQFREIRGKMMVSEE
jgi:Protein of unknown function (DUF1592)/Protein of unknown function (DUF1588)/Protein of unknown function (DUF1587)/Protein of unknown function (DUF1585)/Protein of unknown function (DUF1595)/Planctomycete cytochrome C